MPNALQPVFHAKTNAEALIVQGLLRGEGLDAVVPGSELMDEFAASQRMMGTLGVQVLVPGSQVEQAKEILAAYEEHGASEGPAT